MEVAVADLAELTSAAIAAHWRMWTSASRMTDDDCRAPSLLPGWSRGHVLAHWARNADGQTRMLLAAMRGEVAAQYPGGDAQRDADIETGAARPARLILKDARAAIDRVEDVWCRMPAEAWSRPTAARVGQRPAWMSIWARWRCRVRCPLLADRAPSLRCSRSHRQPLRPALAAAAPPPSGVKLRQGLTPARISSRTRVVSRPHQQPHQSGREPPWPGIGSRLFNGDCD